MAELTPGSSTGPPPLRASPAPAASCHPPQGRPGGDLPGPRRRPLQAAAGRAGGRSASRAATVSQPEPPPPPPPRCRSVAGRSPRGTPSPPPATSQRPPEPPRRPRPLPEAAGPACLGLPLVPRAPHRPSLWSGPGSRSRGGGDGSRSSLDRPGRGCCSPGTRCSPSSPPSCSTPWRR